MVRSRAATSSSTSPVDRRSLLRPICATVICAPTLPIPRPCCAPCSRRATSPARSTSRAISSSPPTSAPTRAPRSGVVPAPSTPARGAPPPRPPGPPPYALPPPDALIRKLRLLLTAYRETGGTRPVVLVHDGAHGTPLIDALARFGDGLPANVLPLEVNEVTQMGLEVIAACFAYGASAMRFLIRGKPRHDITGLTQTLALAEAILASLGCGGNRVAALEVDDPDALAALLWVPHPEPGTAHPASFVAAGGKRDVMRLFFCVRRLR